MRKRSMWQTVRQQGLSITNQTVSKKGTVCLYPFVNTLTYYEVEFMYYKINNYILFRNCKEYGFITDNSLFGYRFLNDKTKFPGEEYISESGAVILDALSKVPQNIDTIVNNLLKIFVDVEFEELKNDTVEFYNYFVERGFLSCGNTYDECDNKCIIDEKIPNDSSTSVVVSECSKNIFNENAFLRSLHIEVTNECNERCVHCYIPHEYKNQMINSDLFFRLIEEAREMNMINITLTGGEPLMHKDIIHFLKKCRELDLSVNVLSNLTLLTDEIAIEMKKNPLLSVQVSIYSMNPSIHDSITKVKGSFERTKAALLKLKKLNIPLQISCPVMKQNLDSFNDVIIFGKENDISVAVNYVIFGSYDHKSRNLENRLSLDEVELAFDKRSSDDDYMCALCDLAKEKFLLTKNDPICTICQYYICVSANGYAFPCAGWQDKIIGNLNTLSLKEICENSKEIKALKQIKWKDFPKCIECKDRGYCTVCMMSNSNESSNKDPFMISDYHCKVASMIHDKVNSYFAKQ